MLPLVKDREISILRMLTVLAVRIVLQTAQPVMLEIMTVAIQRMLELPVKVCSSFEYDWMNILVVYIFRLL